MAVDLKLALARFQQADEFETEQRKREREDLAFYEGDGQWPDDFKQLRKGQAAIPASGTVAGVPAIPARPCITINETRPAVRHVVNEFEQADIGLSIIPADDIESEPIDPNEPELREGLARRIQRQTNAQSARVWAASRATIAGRGFYGLMTRDIPGRTMDQEIYYRRFQNQFAVLLDPAHEEPDGSDADWAFVGTHVPWNIYKAEYGTNADGDPNPVINLNDSEWRALNDDAPGWFTLDGETRSVRVVEYWYHDREVIEYVALEDGSVVEASTLDKSELKTIPANRRKREVRKTVQFAKIDGRNTFEETEWIGPDIPLIEIVGEEMHPFDNERRKEGMVRPMRDPNQGLNFMVSAAVERIGLLPKAPYIGYTGQFEGVEQQWDLANTRTLGRLEINPTTDATGSVVLPPPQRNDLQAGLSDTTQMIGLFSTSIQRTSGVPDPTMENVAPNIRSGRAIRTMIDESARGNSNYMANYIKSVQREGVILNNLLFPVYGNRAGRRVQLQVNPKETRTVILGQKFVQPAEGRAPEIFDPQKHVGAEPQYYALTEHGKFEVAIKVSKQWDTKREQEAEQLGELIGNNPEMITWFGDLWFMSQDGPQHRQMAERAKVMLAPPIQKMLAGGQPDDPRLVQAEQAMQAMQAELMQLKADKVAKIESAQIKAQSDAQMTALDNATKERIAQVNAQTQVIVAELKAQSAATLAEMKAAAESLRTFVEAAHETRLERERHLREAEHAIHDSAHEHAMQHVVHQHTLDEISHEAAVMPPAGSNGSNTD